MTKEKCIEPTIILLFPHNKAQDIEKQYIEYYRKYKKE